MEGGYNLRNPAVKRLMREALELKDKTEQFSAYPLEDNLFEWHFTIRGPVDSDFENGYYHGRIILPPEYPMKPPSIILLTPSGRFETNRKICLSISGFHPESWQPSWSLRTALLGIIGFMPTHGNGAIGSLDYTSEERKLLARKSQEWRCPQCGLIKDLVLPITELSKELTKEAKELGQQISMQGEKQKSTTEETIVSEESTNTHNKATSSTNDLASASQPVSSPESSQIPQAAAAAASNMPQYFSAFQRLPSPGMLPNMPFHFPFPLVMPQFPGVVQNPATSSTGQTTQPQVMNPFLPFPFPPPIMMPNFVFNPGQLPPSVPNVISFPSVTQSFPHTAANAHPPGPPNISQQKSFIQASTATVSSQISPISSPPRPIRPSATQSSVVSLANTAPDSSNNIPEVQVSQNQSQSPTSESCALSVISPELSKPSVQAIESNVKKTETIPSTSVQSEQTQEMDDNDDDDDPVPLAGNLRSRAMAMRSEHGGPTNASRTNVPAAESATGPQRRYATRAGIMDAMTDVFVIILLFCIFGLLARRVSMFL